jgi:hypothetical protein
MTRTIMDGIEKKPPQRYVTEGRTGLILGLLVIALFWMDRENPIIRYTFLLRQSKSWFSPKVKGQLYALGPARKVSRG